MGLSACRFLKRRGQLFALQGLDKISRRQCPGDLARPRRMELAAAVNRLCTAPSSRCSPGAAPSSSCDGSLLGGAALVGTGCVLLYCMLSTRGLVPMSTRCLVLRSWFKAAGRGPSLSCVAQLWQLRLHTSDHATQPAAESARVSSAIRHIVCCWCC